MYRSKKIFVHVNSTTLKILYFSLKKYREKYKLPIFCRNWLFFQGHVLRQGYRMELRLTFMVLGVNSDVDGFFKKTSNLPYLNQKLA